MLLRHTFPCVGTQAVVQSLQTRWPWSHRVLLWEPGPPCRSQVSGQSTSSGLEPERMVMTFQIASFTRRTDSYGTYVNTHIAMKNKNIYWEFLNIGGIRKGGK